MKKGKSLLIITCGIIILVLLTGCPQGVNKKPTIEKAEGPTGAIDASSSTFEWNGNDPDGTIDHYEYRKDEGNWEDNGLSTTYEWSGYTEGEHKFEVRAKDDDGDYSDIISWSFTYQPANKLPVVIKVSGVYGTIEASSSTFEWSGNDPDGTIDHYEYRKDGGSWNTTTSTSYNWSGCTKGPHIFEVRAKDDNGDHSNIVFWLFSFKENKHLTIIGPWTGTEKDSFLTTLEEFEEQSGINVQYKVYRYEDLANLLPAQFATQRTPGDVIFMRTTFIQNNTQHIVELSDVIETGAFRTGALDNVTVENELYGFSYTGITKPGFWYRKSFFEEHELTKPETLNEFVTLLEDISEIEGIIAPIASGNGVGWPLSDVTEHFILTFGGPELQKDLISGNVSWTGETAKKPMNKLASLLSEGYFGEPVEWTTVLEQWWQGQYGLYFMGQWLIGMVDDPSDLGVLALPGNEAVVFALDYAFIPKYSENIDAAKILIKYLGSIEGQTKQIEQGGSIASVKGIKSKSYPSHYKEIASLLEGKSVVNDLDDTIGGMWQTTFWDQLKLLWVRPETLDNILQTLENARN